MTLAASDGPGASSATRLDPPHMIEIVVSPHVSAKGKPHRSNFDCWVVGGPFLCTSRQPFLHAARALLATGCHPDTTLVMRHVGSQVEALRGRVGAAARLTVDEHNGTRFATWKPYPGSTTSSQGQESEEAA